MKDIACDACCLINLLAAGNILTTKPAISSKKTSLAVVQPLGARLYVPAEVAKESLYLLQPDLDDPLQTLVRCPIDLRMHLQSGVLTECQVTGEEETNLYVQLATQIDDGEAACLAISKSRGWAMATDDRPATRLGNEFGVPILNTAQLVKRWATIAHAASAEISAAIINVQRFAKFAPRVGSPDAKWWDSHSRSRFEGS